jgi:myo-inositol-1(or 4)-monophosphatase
LQDAEQAEVAGGVVAMLASAVREAGALAMSKFRTPFKHWTKAGSSPVTEVDMAVDALLRERLAAHAPRYAWLSEETEDDPARLAAERVWIVDPVDGTRGFIAGLPDWTIVAALVEAGRPIAAAIYAPVDDEMFLAEAGRGATLNGIPMRASAGADLRGARVAGPRGRLERLGKLAPGIELQPKVHSLALRLARVAQGRLDAALVGPHSHDWDLAAADLLVHEAGGRLTTTDGRMLIYNRPEPVHAALVAAGPGRHESLAALMRDHAGTS